MTPVALDIFIGLILLVSMLAAYFRGIIKEIFTLLGLTVASFAAYSGGHVLVPEFNRWLSVKEDAVPAKADYILGILSPGVTSKLLAYGGTFIFTFFLMVLTGMLITRWVKEAGLGIVDRGLGGTFGLVRGFLLVFVLYVPATYLIDKEKFPEWAKESNSVPILQATLDWANKTFELDKKIENRGDGIAIKLNKIDLDKIGKRVAPVEEELKKEITKEEKEIQKGVSDIQPDKLLNSMGAPPSAPPPPAPLVLPAAPPEPVIAAPPMPEPAPPPAPAPVISPALPPPASPPP